MTINRTRRSAAVGALTLVLLQALSFGCTKNKTRDGEPAADGQATPAKERVVNLYIWSDYTSRPMLDEFTRRTGIVVKESNYSSNEELLAKLQAGATGFDVAVPSDYMVSVMIKLGLLQELDRARVPNAANVDPAFVGLSHDPQGRYSLPYAWSITGIAVHRGLYKEPVTGWSDLLANPAASGRIALLDDVREVIGAALKLSGASLNATSAADLQKAKATLVAAKKDVKAFSSTPADLLTGDEVALAHMYSGEALTAARRSGKPIEFVIPKEGGTLAIDNMVLLKGARNSDEAYALMNFFLEVETNADLVRRTLFGPVVRGVKETLADDLKTNTSLFPAADVLSKCEMMLDLGEATTLYDRMWSELKAQSH